MVIRENKMTTSLYVERSQDRWLANAIELGGGWASELKWHNGELWIAWATCEDPEPNMLIRNNKDWILNSRHSLDDWRKISSNIDFTIMLGRVTRQGIVDKKEINRDHYATGEFSLLHNPGKDHPTVVWATRSGDSSLILADVGAGKRIQIDDGPGAKLGLKGTADKEGNIYIVWQQWNGDPTVKDNLPQIMLASNKGLEENEFACNGISDGKSSSWAPSISVDPDGGIWCAWDAWNGVAYQIFGRYCSTDGIWGPSVQISGPDLSMRYLNFGADIITQSGKAHITWSRTTEWGTMNHRFNHIRTIHAKLLMVENQSEIKLREVSSVPIMGEDTMLPVPPIPFIWAQDPEFVNPQNPKVMLDKSGSPVVFYRQFNRAIGDRDVGWSLCGVKHNGKDWSPPFRLTEYYGFPDTRYGIAENKEERNGWIIATHAGEAPQSAEGEKHNGHHPVNNHRLILDEVNLDGPTEGKHTGLRHELSDPGALMGFYGPLGPAKKVRSTLGKYGIGHQKYDLLYGDLHRHSAYSKCMSAVDGDPLDHWRWAHDVQELDFYAITEHIELQSYLEWRLVEDLTESLSTNGKVLALHGFELGVPPGHTNFFYTDPKIAHDIRIACLAAKAGGHDLREVWCKLDEWLSEKKIVAIRHYHANTHQTDDLIETYNPKYEQVVEIIQTRAESPGWVQSLWRKGFRVGVVGSSDHSRNAPYPMAMTGLWLPEAEHTRESVLDGLASRRTFATNGVKISAFLSASNIDGKETLIMGDEGEIHGPTKLTAMASGTTRIESVEFRRNDDVIHVETVGSEEVTIDYVDENPGPGEHIYWLKVTQFGELEGTRPDWGVAYTSPVWVTTIE